MLVSKASRTPGYHPQYPQIPFEKVLGVSLEDAVFLKSKVYNLQAAELCLFLYFSRTPLGIDEGLLIEFSQRRQQARTPPLP